LEPIQYWWEHYWKKSPVRLPFGRKKCFFIVLWLLENISKS